MNVAFIDNQAHPTSASFYRMFPWEPISPRIELKVDRIVAENGLKMEWMLERIPEAVQRNGNLFIVSHGTEIGLSMPLATGSGVNADARVMAALDSNQSDTVVAQICMFSQPHSNGAQRVGAIRDKMRIVKALNIKCVELRACNTGLNLAHMQTIKRFFNCGSLGAPNLRDSFFSLGPPRVTSNARRWEDWQRQNPRHRIFDVPADGRVGIAINQTAHSAFSTRMIVNKDSSPSFWADVYLSRLHPHSVNLQNFPGHALFQESNFPLILPGEDAYVEHLVHV